MHHSERVNLQQVCTMPTWSVRNRSKFICRLKCWLWRFYLCGCGFLISPQKYLYLYFSCAWDFPDETKRFLSDRIWVTSAKDSPGDIAFVMRISDFSPWQSAKFACMNHFISLFHFFSPALCLSCLPRGQEVSLLCSAENHTVEPVASSHCSNKY